MGNNYNNFNLKLLSNIEVSSHAIVKGPEVITAKFEASFGSSRMRTLLLQVVYCCCYNTNTTTITTTTTKASFSNMSNMQLIYD